MKKFKYKLARYGLENNTIQFQLCLTTQFKKRLSRRCLFESFIFSVMYRYNILLTTNNNVIVNNESETFLLKYIL